MTAYYTLSTSAIRKIAVLQIMILLSLVLSFGQNQKHDSSTTDLKKEWWYPIIQKHNIDISQFNYKATFTVLNNNVIQSYWLELGKCDTLKDQYLKSKNAIIIVMYDTNFVKVAKRKNYYIQSIKNLMHDLKRNTIDTDYFVERWYDIKDKKIIPLDSIKGYSSIDFNHALKIAPNSYTRILP